MSFLKTPTKYIPLPLQRRHCYWLCTVSLGITALIGLTPLLPDVDKKKVQRTQQSPEKDVDFEWTTFVYPDVLEDTPETKHPFSLDLFVNSISEVVGNIMEDGEANKKYSRKGENPFKNILLESKKKQVKKGKDGPKETSRKSSIRESQVGAFELYKFHEPVHKTLEDVPLTCGEDAPQITYSKHFKTFCWFENKCGCHFQPSQLRCLPYFHVIGFPKCGTSDLYQRLLMHPDVVQTRKETNFWSIVRYEDAAKKAEELRDNNTGKGYPEERLRNFNYKHRTVSTYLNVYLSATNKLKVDFLNSSNTYSNKIIGEGSVTYAYSSLPMRITLAKLRNMDPMDVDCTVADVIHWLTPEAKIIVLLRNPVDRLYSDYRNIFNGVPAHKKTPADFHSRVINRIALWDSCTKNHTKEYCATSPLFEATAVHNGFIGLTRSMYQIHLRHWMEVFPRDQLFFINVDETERQNPDLVAETMDFLELRTLSRETIQKIASIHIPIYKKLRPHQAGHGVPMWETTSKILEDFYRPFNLDLAQLLLDDAYLWYDRTK